MAEATMALKAAREEVYRLQGLGEQASPTYRLAVEEWARRDSERGRLDVEASLTGLEQAAREQRCTTYGALAKASLQRWAEVRHDFDRRSGHMDLILGLCCVRRLPLLTTLCVTETNLAVCEPTSMELAGFEAGARRHGLTVADAATFFASEQKRAWEWGAWLSAR